MVFYNKLITEVRIHMKSLFNTLTDSRLKCASHIGPPGCPPFELGLSRALINSGDRGPCDVFSRHPYIFDSSFSLSLWLSHLTFRIVFDLISYFLTAPIYAQGTYTPITSSIPHLSS